MKKVAIYAGSFNPPTKGHLWVVEQASKLFDEVIVAIAINPDKTYMFTEAERIKMFQEITKDLSNVTVESVGNRYLIDFAIDKNATHLVRGIRGSEDLPTEKTILHFNNEKAPDIQTVFLIPPKDLEDISSSLVRGLIGYDKWRDTVEQYVHPFVFNLIKIKWLEKRWTKLMSVFPAGNKDVQQVRFQQLIDSYNGSDRHYHNLDHLINCLELLDNYKRYSNHPEMIEYALWYHDKWEGREDAIKLAQDAATCLLDINEDNKEYIRQLIQITDHVTDTQNNIDFQIIKDIDLAILGFPEDKYLKYTQDVRKEYSHVSDELFKHGRTDILNKFLAMSQIYQTDLIKERFEYQARKNIKAEIKRLSST